SGKGALVNNVKAVATLLAQCTRLRDLTFTCMPHGSYGEAAEYWGLVSYRLLHLPKHALHILNDVVDKGDGSMVPTLRQSVGRWFVQLASHAWEVFLCAYARSGTWSKPEPRRLQGYSEPQSKSTLQSFGSCQDQH